LTAETAFDSDFTGDASDLLCEDCERVRHVVDGLGQGGDFTLGLDGKRLLQIASGHSGDDLHDAADLLGEVSGHDVYAVGEVLPSSGDAGHVRLAAEASFGSDFAGHAGDFGGEGAKLLDHRVQSFLQQQDLAANVDRDLLGEVAAGNSRRDF